MLNIQHLIRAIVSTALVVVVMCRFAPDLVIKTVGVIPVSEVGYYLLANWTDVVIVLFVALGVIAVWSPKVVVGGHLGDYHRDVPLEPIRIDALNADPSDGESQAPASGSRHIFPDSIHYPVGALHGRHLGRTVGTAIRREMGLPRYTLPNKTVAMQKIEAYRKEHLTHLRVAHSEDFVAHALYHVFQPTRSEIAVMDALHTARAREDRRAVLGRSQWVAPWFLPGMLPWVLPKCIRERFGHFEQYGPDFQ